jgi:hypothetical protein
MRSRRISVGLASLLLGAMFVACSCVVGNAFGAGQALAACELHANGNAIKRVVHIQLDNLHIDRDEPNVPSDLELMPHLREFFVADGTIGGNHQASLPAQPAPEIFTVLTGLLGDRTGIAVGDSYGSFQSDGSVAFASAFAYWTAIGGDGKPLMLADTGKMLPAPWVPFTRAGCDVGVFATVGLALQRPDLEVANVLGASDAGTTARDPGLAEAALFGIAIHCTRGSPRCSSAHARPDLLPDEPGGYLGFNALFGNRDVQPSVSPEGPVADLDGEVIANGAGQPGFPDAPPTATQSLGYAAAMLQAGVPVIYVSIGDAHRTSRRARAYGPGESDHVARLAADDAAFATFIGRLAAIGITKRDTLFIVVSTGNDHFIGGPPLSADCDGLHAPCGYGPTGAIDAAIDRLLATERRNVTTFDIQPGHTPPFYIRGNPQPADPLVRILEQDVSKLTALNPLTGKTDRLAAMVADRAELRLMHMITASPARSPNFMMFGDSGYRFRAAASQADCAAPPACAAADPDAAWARGDVQQMTGGSWFGMAGPGVASLGQTDILSDHADLRPTMLALLGLSDSYAHDGVVLAATIDDNALPPGLAQSREAYGALARAFRDVNAPLGPLGRAGLALSTQAIKGTDSPYQRYLDAIDVITTQRDAVGQQMRTLLDDAAFARRPIDPARATALSGRAKMLINQVEDLASRSMGPADRPWKAASDVH